MNVFAVWASTKNVRLSWFCETGWFGYCWGVLWLTFLGFAVSEMHLFGLRRSALCIDCLGFAVSPNWFGLRGSGRRNLSDQATEMLKTSILRGSHDAKLVAHTMYLSGRSRDIVGSYFKVIDRSTGRHFVDFVTWQKLIPGGALIQHHTSSLIFLSNTSKQRGGPQ